MPLVLVQEATVMLRTIAARMVLKVVFMVMLFRLVSNFCLVMWS